MGGVRMVGQFIKKFQSQRSYCYSSESSRGALIEGGILAPLGVLCNGIDEKPPRDHKRSWRAFALLRAKKEMRNDGGKRGEHRRVIAAFDDQSWRIRMVVHCM